ncbi:MAG: TIGR04282 family arsenosugar biosynthesis glycosyltransferase [Bacteroidota bacterium]
MSAPAQPRRAALLVFAKQPEPGAVKTRLTALLTPGEAADLYAAFLFDSLDAYRHLAETVPLDVRLYLAPSARPAPEGFAPDGASVHAQRGDGLGARMLSAFVETFVAGYERVAVIGTDHPTLPLAFVARAFEELAAPLSVVLGPSDDGGYYLLGMNEVYPQLFQDMTYSHPHVFAETLDRAQATGAAVSVLPPWYDVDTPDALGRLAADLADGEAAHAPRRTRELLAILCEKYEALV